MNTQIHELSGSDLDQVSGGLRDFPFQITPPSAAVVPPTGTGHGPAVPPSHGPFSAPGPGILER